MFDFGFWEIALIMVVALLVLGPERLPRAARTAGLWVGRARQMLATVKADIDRELRAEELKEMAKQQTQIPEIQELGREVNEKISLDVGAAAAAATDEPSAPPVAEESGAAAVAEKPRTTRVAKKSTATRAAKKSSTTRTAKKSGTARVAKKSSTAPAAKKSGAARATKKSTTPRATKKEPSTVAVAEESSAERPTTSSESTE